MQEIGSKVKFQNCVDGDLILGDATIFQVTRSGDVMSSMSPDACVMVVKWTHPDLKKWEIDQITVDYFSSDFTYLGRNLEEVVKGIEEAIAV